MAWSPPGAGDEQRPVIAAPRFVRPEGMKLHGRHWHSLGLERAWQALKFGVPNVNVHGLALGNQSYELGRTGGTTS